DTAAFQTCARVVAWLAGVFASAWQFISEGWNSFISMLIGFSPSQALSGLATGIVSLFDNVWLSVKNGFLKSWNWIVSKLNNIPGVDIELVGAASAGIAKNETAVYPVPELKQSAKAEGALPAVTQNSFTSDRLLTGGELKGIEKGGITKTINSNAKSVTDNSRKIDTVNIYPKEMITPGQLMEFQELGA
ncbi:TPA: phage tail tape measure protein, partial [Citrobacter freundii]|nr:phage tail tape measure protein [Citrobacter freundii]